MKVLFLDIDGVVNCRGTTQRFKGMLGIDPFLAAKVKLIIEKTGCKVVLSSTWRNWPEGRRHVRKMVCDFIDQTGIAESHFRGDEVQMWLNANTDKYGISEYAILDDDHDFDDDQPLFSTSFNTGITDEIAENVINHLNGQQVKV